MTYNYQYLTLQDKRWVKERAEEDLMQLSSTSVMKEEKQKNR